MELGKMDYCLSLVEVDNAGEDRKLLPAACRSSIGARVAISSGCIVGMGREGRAGVGEVD
jgi:hypothetical protein